MQFEVFKSQRVDLNADAGSSKTACYMNLTTVKIHVCNYVFPIKILSKFLINLYFSKQKIQLLLKNSDDSQFVIITFISF